MEIKKGWRMFQKSQVVQRSESYAMHFACFSCRKMFNKHIPSEIAQQYSSPSEMHEQYRPACPQGGNAMLNMGNGFKPPKHSDVKGWSELEKQAKAGKRFWYCPSWL